MNMATRCYACMNELDEDAIANATVYSMDHGGEKYFCDDKKCQKKIEQIIDTFHYTHTMERNGRTYYIADPEFLKYTSDGSSVYKIRVYYKFAKIGSTGREYLTDKFDWETGYVLTVIDNELKEEHGVLHIDKNRIRKR